MGRKERSMGANFSPMVRKMGQVVEEVERGR